MSAMAPVAPGQPRSSRRVLQRLASPIFLAAGVALVVWAIAMGGATFYLVLIFPVVAGSSALLLLGGLCIVVGFFLLPWTLWAGSAEEEWEPTPDAAPSYAAPAPSSGGLVLLGPVPLFIGSWRSAPSWAYWLAAAVGSILLLLVVLFVLGFFF
jgi:uncharacterized membrane protein